MLHSPLNLNKNVLVVAACVANKGFHVGDARVKKLTPASKMCDQSPLGVMLNFEACVNNSDAAQPRVTNVKMPNHIRGFHVGDGWLGGIIIFDTCLKSQHDAEWRASNYRSRPITDFLMQASKFCRRVTNVKTPIRNRARCSGCAQYH